MPENEARARGQPDGSVTLLAILSDSSSVRECICEAICSDSRFRVSASVSLPESLEVLRNTPFDLLVAHTISHDDCDLICAIAAEFSSKLIVVIIGDNAHDPASLESIPGIDVIETMNQIGQIERIRDVVADAKSRLGVHHRVMSEAERIDRERMSLLTDREREIMALTAEGRTVKEIAAQLGRSVSTIETHRENIMRKVGLHDRVALTRLAIRTGLISA